MIKEGEAAIPLETTRRAFGNQDKSKQRSAIVETKNYIYSNSQEKKYYKKLNP